MNIRILGVPMDFGSGHRGVDMGPSAIRIAGISEKLRALGLKVIDEGNINIKVPELLKIKNQKLKYLPEIVHDCTVLAKKVEKILERKDFPLVLGGDHAIAIGTIAGISSYCKKKKKTLGILWIDAHGDMNTEKTTPSGNIHGMPLAVSIGLGIKDLTSLGGSYKKVDSKNVVMVGIRDLDDGEKVTIKNNAMNIFSMEEIDKRGISPIIEESLHLLRNVDHLHISFDVDAIDPEIAPGVGTPVRGGLDFREAHFIMEAIAQSKRMASLEVVEVNPILDVRNQSAKLTVELVQSAFGKKII